MFLSTNDNIAPWFKAFCECHLMAPYHVCNPMWFDDIFYVNDNDKPRRKLRVWVSEPMVLCATTLEIACSHISSRPL